MGFEHNVSIDRFPAAARPFFVGPALALSTSFPDGMDQIDGRIQDPARDNEQNEPYQIVDLLSQFGRGLLHCLRTPKDRFQKYDDRDCRDKDGDELEHIVSLRLMKNPSQVSSHHSP
jgi:hypothetical protein